MNTSLNEVARMIIADTIYLTLATVTPEGRPWATPLFFAYSPDYDFFFTSARGSRHVANMGKNPHAAITIFDSKQKWGQGNAVYMEGMTSQVSDQDLPGVVTLLNARRHALITKENKRTPEVFMGQSPRRLYQFHPDGVYVLDPRSDPTVKHLVDFRVKVDVFSP